MTVSVPNICCVVGLQTVDQRLGDSALRAQFGSVFRHGVRLRVLQADRGRLTEDSVHVRVVCGQRLLHPGAVGGLHLAEVGHLLLGAPLALTGRRSLGVLLAEPFEDGEEPLALLAHLGRQLGYLVFRRHGAQHGGGEGGCQPLQ